MGMKNKHPSFLLLLLFPILIVCACFSPVGQKWDIFHRNSAPSTTEVSNVADATEQWEALELNNHVVEKNASTKKKKTKEQPILSDTPKFVNKYLVQQLQGKMPEGADGTKVAYLTFDDGPSTTVTPKILKVLKKKNVKATFFVIGKELDRGDKEGARAMLKQIYADGHAIGNHTYSHNYNYLYPKRIANKKRIMADLDKNLKLFQSILGKDFSTNTIRLPGGTMSWNGLEKTNEALKKKGYYYIDWNASNKDAEGGKKTAKDLLQATISTVGTFQRVVILMHDTYGKDETAKALPKIIDYLKEQGYEFRCIKD